MLLMMTYFPCRVYVGGACGGIEVVGQVAAVFSCNVCICGARDHSDVIGQIVAGA